MLAAVGNTSDGPRNILRNTDKFSDGRHQLIRPTLSPLIDGKEEIGRGQARVDCIQDYSPCSCSSNYYNETVVRCEGVSVETVRDVFQRDNDPEIYQLEFYPLDDATNLISRPADFLGNTSVTNIISINCGYSSNYANFPNLVIDSLAFRSSQNSLVDFSIIFFDFGMQKDFNFLNGFNKLVELRISFPINLAAFQYLPPLPSLQLLSVARCPEELNQMAFPDLSPAKLKYLELWDSEINDQTADKILSQLAASSSADSLEWLSLSGNSLTRIPIQVGSAFPQIKSVYLGGNSFSHIPSSSLTFNSTYLEDLNFVRSGINTIESGAFRGIQYTVHLQLPIF